MIQWYYARRERQGYVDALLLEDRTVEWVVEQNGVEEQPTPFSELVGSMAVR